MKKIYTKKKKRYQGDLPQDFTHRNLSGDDFNGNTLTGNDFSHSNLSNATFVGTTLTGAMMIKTNLSRADLSRANLTNADLTEANLTNADLSSANLTNVDLTNANLTNADFNGGSNLTNTNFSGANLRGVLFSNMELNETKFINATFIDLSISRLIKVDLTNAKITRLFSCKLARCTLINADLSGAELYSSDFERARLQGANLEGATITQCTLIDTNLEGSNLLNTQFKNCGTLVRANVKNTILDLTKYVFVHDEEQYQSDLLNNVVVEHENTYQSLKQNFLGQDLHTLTNPENLLLFESLYEKLKFNNDRFGAISLSRSLQNALLSHPNDPSKAWSGPAIRSTSGRNATRTLLNKPLTRGILRFLDPPSLNTIKKRMELLKKLYLEHIRASKVFKRGGKYTLKKQLRF